MGCSLGKPLITASIHKSGGSADVQSNTVLVNGSTASTNNRRIAAANVSMHSPVYQGLSDQKSLSNSQPARPGLWGAGDSNNNEHFSQASNDDLLQVTPTLLTTSSLLPNVVRLFDGVCSDESRLTDQSRSSVPPSAEVTTANTADTMTPAPTPMQLPRPSTAKKGFVTFDVILDSGVQVTALEEVSKRPLPRRLKRLEPLENAPKLTAEMLQEKLERADILRQKNLASRRSRTSDRHGDSSVDGDRLSCSTSSYHSSSGMLSRSCSGAVSQNNMPSSVDDAELDSILALSKMASDDIQLNENFSAIGKQQEDRCPSALTTDDASLSVNPNTNNSGRNSQNKHCNGYNTNGDSNDDASGNGETKIQHTNDDDSNSNSNNNNTTEENNGNNNNAVYATVFKVTNRQNVERSLVKRKGASSGHNKRYSLDQMYIRMQRLQSVPESGEDEE